MRQAHLVNQTIPQQRPDEDTAAFDTHQLCAAIPERAQRLAARSTRSRPSAISTTPGWVCGGVASKSRRSTPALLAPVGDAFMMTPHPAGGAAVAAVAAKTATSAFFTIRHTCTIAITSAGRSAHGVGWCTA
jgi:hypothetical protein